MKIKIKMMKMKKTKSLPLIPFMGLALVFVGMALTYANCGSGFLEGFSATERQASSSEPEPLPLNHSEAVVPLKATTVDTPLMDRRQIASFLRDIFQSAAQTAQERADVDAVLAAEIENYPHVFGHSCDIALHPYVEFERCSLMAANISSPLRRGPSVLRETSVSGACTRLTSRDHAVLAALSQAGVQGFSPNSERIEKVFQLFYPGVAVESQALETWVALDRDMTLNSESSLNRWRVILNLFCESQAWQIL